MSRHSNSSSDYTLLRAEIKPPELLPSFLMCCERRRRLQRDMRSFVFHCIMESVAPRAAGFCVYCGTVWPRGKDVVCVENMDYALPLEMLQFENERIIVIH